MLLPDATYLILVSVFVCNGTMAVPHCSVTEAPTSRISGENCQSLKASADNKMLTILKMHFFKESGGNEKGQLCRNSEKRFVRVSESSSLSWLRHLSGRVVRSSQITCTENYKYVGLLTLSLDILPDRETSLKILAKSGSDNEKKP